MTTQSHSFILIHGAWHASWCWNKIAAHLASHGHKVIAPDLPGHGTNWRPANTVTFNDYVDHVVHLIQQQTEPVTLIGHSLAGLIISQAAEKMADQIRELVFVSAYIPHDNLSLLAIAEASASRAVSPHLLIDRSKHEIALNASPELVNIFFNCCSKEDAEFAMTKLQAQPLQPFTAPVAKGPHFERVPKRSFVSKHDRAMLLTDQERMSKMVTDDIYYLEADHAAYYSADVEIATLLLNK